MNHPMILEIITKYSNGKVINADEITTIQFASTCKHLILSHGTFSAVIGYLAFYSNIHYSEYNENTIWHGDIFSIDGWTKHDLDS